MQATPRMDRILHERSRDISPTDARHDGNFVPAGGRRARAGTGLAAKIVRIIVPFDPG
jgi:hypothetical protein